MDEFDKLINAYKWEMSGIFDPRPGEAPEEKAWREFVRNMVKILRDHGVTEENRTARTKTACL